MKVDFLDPAKAEFAEAVAFYNRESEGLGFEFAAEVKRTIERIVQFPAAWAPLSKRTRRCRTNRFPYGIIYQVREELILIVAVMHLRRHPDSWKSRLSPTDR
jgi:plasmid stabilization system protein ParE